MRNISELNDGEAADGDDWTWDRSLWNERERGRIPEKKGELTNEDEVVE